MKYITSLIILSTVIFLLASCNSDIIEPNSTPFVPANETVSGTAFYDLDGDGVGEQPMEKSLVYLGDSITLSGDSIIITTDVLETIVDVEGNYIFEGVQPKENQVIRIVPGATYSNLIGIDNIVDGDLNETLDNELIQITIDENETDDGNDFVAYKETVIVIPPSISGLVQEFIDINIYLPAPGHRMELYERNIDGFPTTSTGEPLAEGYSDSDGYYEFKNIPSGEYVIYHIGTGDYPYTCISNMDITPEAGEPTENVGCQFIAVNLSDIVTLDSNNVYIIEKIIQEDPGTLYGIIYEDITSDGQPDELTDKVATVEIYARDVDGFKTGPILHSSNSTEEGSYIIENIAPGNYVVTLAASSDFSTIWGKGEGGGPHPLPDHFPLTIDGTGSTIDSEFWIYTNDNIPSISGTVYEDTDGDMIGDELLYNHAVQLYERDANNLPIGDILYQTGTNSGGSFFFTNLSVGDYILVLTGPSNYNCAASGDESPESGEPTISEDCRYINVDFQNNVEDTDNIFVLQQ